MEEALSDVLGEAERRQSEQQIEEPVPQSVIVHLQFVLDNAVDDPEGMDCLYEELSSRNLSLDSIVCMITSAMDCALVRLSLLASKVYVTLLLSSNAPVFTLFTPVAFLSLLRSVRQGLKNWRSSGGSAARRKSRKRKGTGRGKHVDDDAGSEDGDANKFDGRILITVVERLEPVIGLVHLSRFPDSLKLLVQTVVSVLTSSHEGCNGQHTGLNKSCWRILGALLRPEHGDQGVTSSEILKSLSPSILSPKSQTGESAIHFVTKKMKEKASESPEIKKAIVNLPRYLAQKAPEKSELRALAVESIMEIVRSLEHGDQIEFADYVVRMTQGKHNLRLLAVDLLPCVVGRIHDSYRDSWGMKCFQTLLERSSDTNAIIRSRALTNMANLVTHLYEKNQSCSLLKKIIEEDDDVMDNLLRKRCLDEKAAVRKAALFLLTKLSAQKNGLMNLDILKLVSASCSDPLVSIRKAAIAALSETLRNSSDRTVIREWLHSVPRLVNDSETSIQEECENFFMELVIGRLSEARYVSVNGDCSDLKRLFPDGMMELMEEISHGEVSPWIRKLCVSLGKKNRLKSDIAVSLQNIIRISESLWSSSSREVQRWTAPPGAWFLLSEVSLFVPKSVDWDFLHHYWQILDGARGRRPAISDDMEEDDPSQIGSVSWAADRVFLLKTISNVSLRLPPEPAADLAHNLLNKLERFSMHSSEVNAHVRALKTLCVRKAANGEEADVLVSKWVQQLLTRATRILEELIDGPSRTDGGDEFRTPPAKTGRRPSARQRRLSDKAVVASYTVGALAIACPSANMKSVVPVLHAVILSGNSPSSKFPTAAPAVDSRQISPPLYAQAWITMGKICLADGKLAKKYIPLFVQELEKSENPAIRNNIVVTMADFCVRYTALIDCYISRITKCLRDSCELVRRQTFILLARLLQRDYVKWRGILFLRFLLSLVDESEKIRQLADYLFGNILKVKAPLLAYNSFVEAIFVLNDCYVHDGGGGHEESRGRRLENRLFAIRGNDEGSRSRRMHIYTSLLKQMAPEHLLATFAKVCGEILAAASDGVLKMDELSGQSVLQDAFQILGCKEIRITPGRGPGFGSGGGGGELDDDGGDAAATVAKGRVLNQAIKKGVIQHTVPIFIELKRMLESNNSPLTGSLMECLRIVLKDYKNEIEEILVADKQLQKELIYDMRKFDLNRARTAAERCGGGGESRGRNSARTTAFVTEDAAAAASARSVIKQMNSGGPLTPPLSAISIPKLRPSLAAGNGSLGRPAEVLQSLRRRQSFGSDDEN